MSGRTAVVGAGLAGVVCALDLSASREVELFERELHPGGRLAACRGGGFEFDCGAPYFMATAPEFRERLRDWLMEDFLARWEGWAVELDNGNLLTRDPGATRYVGVPSMAALAGKLASLLDLRTGVDVTQLSREADGWWLIDAMQQRHGPFSEVICATPPADAARLLEAHAPELAQRARAVTMRPRWVAMLGFDDALAAPFDSAHVEGGALAWCGRNSAKPGRVAREAWVLLANPEWSEARANVQEGVVIEALSQAFATALGVDVRAAVSLARFWDAAEPINPLGDPFLADEELKLYACGDWCVAPRVEGAFLSAAALAAALDGTEF
ncbi:MAG: NAD(P)-binding protein [Acidihalobacter sp.]